MIPQWDVSLDISDSIQDKGCIPKRVSSGSNCLIPQIRDLSELSLVAPPLITK